MKSRFVVAVLALALVLAGCSKNTDDGPSAKETGEAEEIVQIHPLTGVPLPEGRPQNPVFVVKVDNTPPAAPQYGLGKADMIVEQLVEGGLTRLAAMYYSTIPTEIGHVRSMRATDVGIAAPVDGRIVASGGAQKTIKRVKNAGITFHLEDSSSTGFSSDGSRGRPYNRMLNLKTIADKLKPVTVKKDYFLFGDGITGLMKEGAEASPDADKPLAKKATSARVRFSPESLRTFSFTDGKWRRTNGLPTIGADFASDNLIVVQAPIEDAGYRDPGGAFVPETVFKGSGDAWIAEGDQWIKAKWSKKERGSRLAFTTTDGQEIGVKPGTTWLELLPDTNSGAHFK